MWGIVRYIWLTARRDWLFLGLCALFVLAGVVSVFLGSTALVEQQQMTLAYMASSYRMILMVGLIVFVAFHMRRSFDHKEVDVIISHALSRVSFVCAVWLGFTSLGVLLAALATAMLLWANVPDPEGMVLWASSLLAEIGIVIGFALVTSLILRSAVAATLATFSFYIVSRMMGFFQLLLRHSIEPTDFTSTLSWMAHWILKTISVVVPRLDLYAPTHWLVYGIVENATAWMWLQSLFYVPFLLAVATVDFQRRDF